MKKVIVVSENPVKVKVAERAFMAIYPEEQFEFVAIKSDSGVPDQPMVKRQGLERLTDSIL
jgi:non-canonical (house-cleaning) NTP pyrophosphatase